MLEIKIPKSEYFDEANSSFITEKEVVLKLEHSLVSISKWESKWKKPFLSNDDKTTEEVISYIEYMTITQNVKTETYNRLTPSMITEINHYIKDPMTATTISSIKNKTNPNEVVTSELIYYWMTVMNVPVEFQKWHLNRLLTFIKLCNVKNSPPKKMDPTEAAIERRRLNEERKKKYNTKG